MPASGEGAAYWRDVGTVDAYYQANMELLAVTPALNLYDRDWPIWTYAEIKPPAKFVHDEDGGRRGMALSKPSDAAPNGLHFESFRNCSYIVSWRRH